MNLEALLDRAGGNCELCGSDNTLSAFEVEPSDGSDEQSICICQKCEEQISSGYLDETHFTRLQDTMWSEIPAVAVMSYRLIDAFARQDLLDIIYLDDEILSWAKAKKIGNADSSAYVDANGVRLQAGDTVVVTKDLDVKGTSFVAKRGTAVRNISLVPGDSTHIEGRVNGVKIQILTKYLKKS